MGFREVGVLRREKHDFVPELSVGDVILQARHHVLCFTDVHLAARAGLGAEKEVDARALRLIPRRQLVQSGVENVFSRYKAIFGGHLRTKRQDSQQREAQIGCAILNKLRALGSPTSVRVE